MHCTQYGTISYRSGVQHNCIHTPSNLCGYRATLYENMTSTQLNPILICNPISSYPVHIIQKSNMHALYIQQQATTQLHNNIEYACPTCWDSPCLSMVARQLLETARIPLSMYCIYNKCLVLNYKWLQTNPLPMLGRRLGLSELFRPTTRIP